MTTQRTARIAVVPSLALFALSACAQAVTGGYGDETWDEVESGGMGGASTAGPTPAASGSASSTGGGGSADDGTGSAGCGPEEHFCGGVCTANTPGTGCSQSESCDPCPAPAHATPTCNAMGACDFACEAGYNEIDGQCLCASQCCSTADCSGGNVCSSGSCQPPPCYFSDCLEACLLSLKCGGFCVGNTCMCLACQ